MLAGWLVLILAVLAMLAGAISVLALIACIVTASFLVATQNASPRPADSRLDAAGLAALWLREVLVAWSIFLVLMPLERWLMRRDIPATRQDLPSILLIHGYVNNAGAMFILWRAIKRAGFAVHTLNLEPLYGSIDRYAASIEDKIVAMQQGSGGRRVVLVCHSMGGLAARAYLRRYGGGRIAKLITLGTPHNGTVLALTAAGENGRQMRPHSAWLEELARFEGGVWPFPVVSLFSRDDNIVAPQLSAELAGARNVAVAGIGHMSLPMNGSIARFVVAELASVTPSGPG